MVRPQGSRLSLRLSDEELEFYGDLYVRCRLRNAGVDFETFLSNPEYYLLKHAKDNPAVAALYGLGGRKGLLRFLRLRHAVRASSQ